MRIMLCDKNWMEQRQLIGLYTTNIKQLLFVKCASELLFFLLDRSSSWTELFHLFPRVGVVRLDYQLVPMDGTVLLLLLLRGRSSSGLRRTEWRVWIAVEVAVVTEAPVLTGAGAGGGGGRPATGIVTAQSRVVARPVDRTVAPAPAVFQSSLDLLLHL